MGVSYCFYAEIVEILPIERVVIAILFLQMRTRCLISVKFAESSPRGSPRCQALQND